jgi:hypothetical protein
MIFLFSSSLSAPYHIRGFPLTERSADNEVDLDLTDENEEEEEEEKEE